jgi:hypothetical protein
VLSPPNGRGNEVDLTLNFARRNSAIGAEIQRFDFGRDVKALISTGGPVKRWPLGRVHGGKVGLLDLPVPPEFRTNGVLAPWHNL